MTARPTLRLHPGSFAVCRLAPGTALCWPEGGSFVSVTRTRDELSIVCREEKAPDGARVEPGWRLLEVEGPLDITQTGVLAALAKPLAEASVSIFVVSTWDTDYLLVKDAQWSRARSTLTAAGYRLARR